MLGAAVVLLIEQMSDTYATSCTTAGAGKVCLGTTLRNCAPGCYCTGGGNWSISVTAFWNACSGRWSNIDGEHGAYLCPYDFPLSGEASSSVASCYQEVGGKQLYYKQIDCGEGFFLPKDSDTKKKCTSGKVCKGGSFYPSTTNDQGIEDCSDGFEPNAEQTACVKATKNCPAGTYLPKQSRECEDCPNGYVCLGGNYEVDYPTDQGKLLPKDACKTPNVPDNVNYVANGYGDGCDKCATGTQANTSHTECVEAAIKISKGYYLKANSVTPTKCDNSCKFCPGGNFWKSSVDQGQYDCPTCSSAPFYASCSISLTPEQMEFGAIGNNSAVACWTKTDPYDYQYCVFGLRGIRASGGQDSRTQATTRPVQQVSVSSVNR